MHRQQLYTPNRGRAGRDVIGKFWSPVCSKIGRFKILRLWRAFWTPCRWYFSTGQKATKNLFISAFCIRRALSWAFGKRVHFAVKLDPMFVEKMCTSFPMLIKWDTEAIGILTISLPILDGFQWFKRQNNPLVVPFWKMCDYGGLWSLPSTWNQSVY